MSNQIKQNFEKISKILKTKIINFDKCPHTKHHKAILNFNLDLKDKNLKANVHSSINFDIDEEFYYLETLVEIYNKNQIINKILFNDDLDDDFLNAKNYISKIKEKIKIKV